jgi:hypothetical protein
VTVLLLWLSPSSALAGPHYPYGTQPGELESAGTPLEDVGRCRSCHGDYAADDDYEPFDSWSTSAMGNATRDPVFLAALTVAVQDDASVGEYCLRCHTPQGWLAGRADPGDGTALDPATDHDGVTCDTCHRMIEATFVRNGIYYIDHDTQKHGKYPDALDVGHAHLVDPFTSSSELCGTCHHVSSPVHPHLAADGTEISDSFPLETTYLEWLASDFARDGTTCIECHMAPVSGVRTSAIEDAPVRDLFRRHDFLGSNAWLGRAVTWTTPSLGREAAFEAHAARTRDFLGTAATVEVTSVPEDAVAGDSAEIGVRVTNWTGHKLPTGYADGRRMWLEVSIGGQVVSGRYDEDEAELEGDAALQMWEAVHGAHGTPDESLGHQDTVVSDNRIPPAGFVEDERTAPVGETFEGNWADVRLEVPLPRALSGDVTVRVRLRHQVLTRHYVEFLRDANVTDDRGEVLYDAWAATGRAPPEDLAEVEATMSVAPAPPDLRVRGGACGVAGKPAPLAWAVFAASVLALAAMRQWRRK